MWFSGKQKTKCMAVSSKWGHLTFICLYVENVSNTNVLLSRNWQPTRFVRRSCLFGKSLDQMLEDMFGTPRDYAFLTQIVPAAWREGDVTHEHMGHLFFFSLISIFKCKRIVEVSKAGFRLFCHNVCLAQVCFFKPQIMTWRGVCRPAPLILKHDN